MGRHTPEQLTAIAHELDDDVWSQIEQDMGPIVVSVRGRVVVIDTPDALLEILDRAWTSLPDDPRLALQAIVLFNVSPNEHDVSVLVALAEARMWDVEEHKMRPFGIAAARRIDKLARRGLTTWIAQRGWERR